MVVMVKVQGLGSALMVKGLRLSSALVGDASGIERCEAQICLCRSGDCSRARVQEYVAFRYK
jgi:hypothetical protein